MNRVSQLVLNLISSNNKELEFMKTWIVPSKVMSSPLVSPWANVFWIQEFLRPLFLQRIHRVDDGPRVSHQVDHVQVVSTDPSLLRQSLQYSSHLSHWKADCLDNPEQNIINNILQDRQKTSWRLCNDKLVLKLTAVSWYRALFKCVLMRIAAYISCTVLTRLSIYSRTVKS